MSHLTKMTVKSLREVATRMDLESALRALDLPKISRALKADLVKVITYGIEDDMTEALETASRIDTREDNRAVSQLRGWWKRHGLDRNSEIFAEDIIGARTRDHMAALAHDYLRSYLPRRENIVSAYRAQTGAETLTPAQKRREGKKHRRANKNVAAILLP